jgi:hypothetical protein
VTEFIFQAYDQGDVWSGVVIYTPDKIPAVVEAVDKYYKIAPANSALAVGIGCPPGSNIPTILISPFYNGSEADGRQNFKSFFDIGPVMEMLETKPYVKQVLSKFLRKLIVERALPSFQSIWDSQVSKIKCNGSSHPSHRQCIR